MRKSAWKSAIRHDTCTRPDVSVLMTVFNTAAYLAEAIDSVLSQQTGRSFELIVVDDGSSDGSLGIALAYAKRHPDQVRVLRHSDGGNRGISASRNLALHHARAPLLAFLDSDDVWLPHHLETQCDVLKFCPETDFVYAAAERWVDFKSAFDEEKARRSWWGQNYVPPLVPEGEACGLLAPGALLEWFLHDESMVPCICTVVVRTSAARAAGGFQAEFRGLYDDQVFHVKMARSYRIYANDVCTARYRRHNESCCARGEVDDQTRTAARDHFHEFLADHAKHTHAFQQDREPDRESGEAFGQGCGGAVDCRSTMLAESSRSGTGPVSSM